MIYFLVILNFGISYLNAWGVGRTWEESKREGGFSHFVTWCAAIMSTCGFTWCYTIILAYLAGNVAYHGHPFLPPRYVQGMVELGYLIVIFPILGSGIGITISSWRDFSRRRNLMNGGIAAYNTYAQIHNTVEAIRVLPGVLKDIGDLFSSKDEDNSGLALIVVALVALALLGGFFTSFAIIKHTATVHRYQVQAELACAEVRR